MKTRAIFAVVVFASATQAQQQNTPKPEQQHAEMMKRGDTGMGFSQEKTTHHFFLLRDGGAIQVSANDPKDDVSRDHIRMHLSHVAKDVFGRQLQYSDVHNTMPPGVPTLERLHKEIRYHYEQTDTRAKVVMATTNPKALRLSTSSCGFRISEHKTGDPMKPAGDDLKRE